MKDATHFIEIFKSDDGTTNLQTCEPFPLKYFMPDKDTIAVFKIKFKNK